MKLTLLHRMVRLLLAILHEYLAEIDFGARCELIEGWGKFDTDVRIGMGVELMGRNIQVALYTFD